MCTLHGADGYQKPRICMRKEHFKNLVQVSTFNQFVKIFMEIYQYIYAGRLSIIMARSRIKNNVKIKTIC